jgi:WD40 repeat protein
MLLATGRERMYLWDLKRLKLVNQASSGSAIGAPAFAAFSPDGRLLAWSSYSRTGISLWDASASNRFGPDLVDSDRAIWSLAFSPDSKTLAAACQDGTIVLWDFDVESWINRACSIANRALTAEEREQYIVRL